MELLFDTHAHYYDEMYDTDRDEILSRMPKMGVGLILNAGCDIKTSKISIELSKKYPFIYAAAGIHPHQASEMEEGDLAELKRLLDCDKVAAVGEIGLDYHYDFSPKDVQKSVFDSQLSIAEEKNMPVIIHEREAASDVFDILSAHRCKGVYHCYSGSVEMAKRIADLGFIFSFTGMVTFKNSKRAQEVAAYLPIEQIMIETDCPYMTPVPHRGERNHSGHVMLVAQKIAELKGMDLEDVIRITRENGKRLFNIK